MRHEAEEEEEDVSFLRKTYTDVFVNRLEELGGSYGFH